MLLEFTVTEHSAGSKFVDGRPRVTLTCFEADAIDNTLRLAVDDLAEFPLGESVSVAVQFVEVKNKK